MEEEEEADDYKEVAVQELDVYSTSLPQERNEQCESVEHEDMEVIIHSESGMSCCF